MKAFTRHNSHSKVAVSLLLVQLAMLGFVFSFSGAAIAATYEAINVHDPSKGEQCSETVFVKGHYYRMQNTSTAYPRLFVSDSESGPWKNTGLDKYSVASKDEVFGVPLASLVSYNIKTGSSKKLLKFSGVADLKALYKNNAYLEFYDSNGDGCTIVCDIKKRKIIGKYGDMIPVAFSGNYLVSYGSTDDYGFNGRTYLYKLTTSGMKKVRTFPKKTEPIDICNGKVYYFNYKKSKTNPSFCVQTTSSAKEKTVVSAKLLKGVYAAEPFGTIGCDFGTFETKDYYFVPKYRYEYHTAKLVKL